MDNGRWITGERERERENERGRKREGEREREKERGRTREGDRDREKERGRDTGPPAADRNIKNIQCWGPTLCYGYFYTSFTI